MKKVLTLPVSEADIKELTAGDVFYLSGELVTGRDDVHRRVVKEGMECPVNLKGGAIYHAGPIIRELTEKYELVSVGPTTSMRMDAYAAGFLEKTDVKIMIGKGGMGDKTAAACKKFGAIHCVCPGGCAVYGALQVEEVKGVHWRELGMPEAMWMMKVNEFGPLIVTIDSNGNNMFSENKAFYASNKEAAEAPIIEYVSEF